MAKGPKQPPPIDRPPVRRESPREPKTPDDRCSEPINGRVASAALAPGTVLDVVAEGERAGMYANGALEGWLAEPAATAAMRCMARGWRYEGVATESLGGDSLVRLMPVPAG